MFLFKLIYAGKSRKKTCAGYWLLKQELLTTDSVLTHTGILLGIGAISKLISQTVHSLSIWDKVMRALCLTAILVANKRVAIPSPVLQQGTRVLIEAQHKPPKQRILKLLDPEDAP